MDADALEDLPPADVVILGEYHDNPTHHRNQAAAVEALQPRALVFEMLTPGQAEKAVPDLRPDADALGAALAWEESGWPDFVMYHPIFAAAPEAVVFGGALPPGQVRAAVGGSAAATFGAEAARYGLDRPLAADEQATREEEQGTAHCGAMPVGMLPGMVEAQRLRDAALARAVLEALDATGGPVALITGNGHARLDRGVPVYLEAARPGLSVLSIGQLEAAEDDAPFDLWVVTEAADRPDPCAVFD
ncbi:ChaN family lipoprotein [Rhodobacteraceae bacterium MCCB 386]|nr:ChaN family lipoprotein [Roseitranquillus sediminis]